MRRHLLSALPASPPFRLLFTPPPHVLGRCGDIIDEYASRLPPFDVLTGGFPCQPFSQRGEQQGLDDERGGLLYTECVRVLAVCQPRAFLFENVPQLAVMEGGWRPIRPRAEVGDAGETGEAEAAGETGEAGAPGAAGAVEEQCVAGATLRAICTDLESTGYVVSWQLLHAHRWVAQSRLRLYIVGIRKDLPGASTFRFPSDLAASAAPKDGAEGVGAARSPTVRDCLLEAARAGESHLDDLAACALSSDQWARITSEAFCAKSNRSARSRELCLDGPSPTIIASYRRTLSLTTK